LPYLCAVVCFCIASTIRASFIAGVEPGEQHGRPQVGWYRPDAICRAGIGERPARRFIQSRQPIIQMLAGNIRGGDGRPTDLGVQSGFGEREQDVCVPGAVQSQRLVQFQVTHTDIES
jgi:hypothetical protein